MRGSSTCISDHVIETLFYICVVPQCTVVQGERVQVFVVHVQRREGEWVVKMRFVQVFYLYKGGGEGVAKMRFVQVLYLYNGGGRGRENLDLYMLYKGGGSGLRN